MAVLWKNLFPPPSYQCTKDSLIPLSTFKYFYIIYLSFIVQKKKTCWYSSLKVMINKFHLIIPQTTKTSIPLKQACENDDLACVKALVALGINLDEEDELVSWGEEVGYGEETLLIMCRGWQDYMSHAKRGVCG